MKILHILGPGRLPKNPKEAAVSGIVRVGLEVAARQVILGHEVSIAVSDEDNWETMWKGVNLIGLSPIKWAKFKFFLSRL